MESLKDTPLNVLEFNPNTLLEIRKTFNLDTPGRMDDAIRILEEWIKKQDHFVTKDFDRDLLERYIIRSKGLIERVKKRLDKYCTLRTLLPDYFQPYNVKEDFKDIEDEHFAVMPKLTPDNYRIFLIRYSSKMLTERSNAIYKRSVMAGEFLNRYDYSLGVHIIHDLREVNILDVLTKIDITDFRKFYAIWIDGYAHRVKNAHLITESNMIDSLINLVKPMLSTKIMSRVHVHKNAEALQNYFPVELLPADYGGQNKCLKEMFDEWVDVLSSDDHIEYMKKASRMRTDESLRPVDEFNDEYLGTAGTFRTFVVD